MRRPQSGRAAGTSDAGTVFAEYVSVLVLVTLGLGLATYTLGPRLVQLFALQRMWLSTPML